MVKSIVLDSHLSNHPSDFSQSINKPIEDAKSHFERSSVSASTASKEKEDMQANLTEAAIKKSIKGKEEKEVEEEELKEAFETVSEFMSLYNRNVNFSLDEGSDKTIIKVFDSDSKELIKQFPSEDLLEMARKIHAVRQDIDLKTGIFLDEKV